MKKSNDDLVVTMTIEQLRELVRESLADLIDHGSRQALHDHGLIHTVGRDHPVRDRDILQIHFKA